MEQASSPPAPHRRVAELSQSPHQFHRSKKQSKKQNKKHSRQKANLSPEQQELAFKALYQYYLARLQVEGDKYTWARAYEDFRKVFGLPQQTSPTSFAPQDTQNTTTVVIIIADSFTHIDTTATHYNAEHSPHKFILLDDVQPAYSIAMDILFCKQSIAKRDYISVPLAPWSPSHFMTTCKSISISWCRGIEVRCYWPTQPKIKHHFIKRTTAMLDEKNFQLQLEQIMSWYVQDLSDEFSRLVDQRVTATITPYKKNKLLLKDDIELYAPTDKQLGDAAVAVYLKNPDNICQPTHPLLRELIRLSLLQEFTRITQLRYMMEKLENGKDLDDIKETHFDYKILCMNPQDCDIIEACFRTLVHQKQHPITFQMIEPTNTLPHLRK